MEGMGEGAICSLSTINWVQHRQPLLVFLPCVTPPLPCSPQRHPRPIHPTPFTCICCSSGVKAGPATSWSTKAVNTCDSRHPGTQQYTSHPVCHPSSTPAAPGSTHVVGHGLMEDACCRLLLERALRAGGCGAAGTVDTNTPRSGPLTIPPPRLNQTQAFPCPPRLLTCRCASSVRLAAM